MNVSLDTFLLLFVTSFLFANVAIVEARCFNDQNGTRVDTGCTANSPMCFNEDGSEPTDPSVQGYLCGMCINDKFGDNADTGCPRLTPRCVGFDGRDLDANKGGTVCAYAVTICHNNATGNSVDEGCDAANPICVDGRTRREVGSGEVGEKCAFCINSHDNANPGVDLGCTADAPRCVMMDGTEFALDRAGELCCPTGGCPTSCPCFGMDSIYAKIKSMPGVYTFESCNQSYNHESIEAYIRYGINTVALVGAGGGWWGAGACYDDFYETGEPNLLSPASQSLAMTSSDEGQTCENDLRLLLQEVFGVDSVQECDFVYT